MEKTNMKKSREYLCFKKRDESGKFIRDSDGDLIAEYREVVVYRVNIIDNGNKYEWCIHHSFNRYFSKYWCISDCGTGLKLGGIYRTRREAYEGINEELVAKFLEVSKTEYYKRMYNSHNNATEKIGKGINIM